MGQSPIHRMPQNGSIECATERNENLALNSKQLIICEFIRQDKNWRFSLAIRARETIRLASLNFANCVINCAQSVKSAASKADILPPLNIGLTHINAYHRAPLSLNDISTHLTN